MDIHEKKRVIWLVLRILLAVCVVMQLLIGAASASTQGGAVNAEIMIANLSAFTAEHGFSRAITV